MRRSASVILTAFVLATTLVALTNASLANEAIKTDGSDIGIAIMGAIIQDSPEKNVALVKDSSGKVIAVKADHVILDKFKVLAVHPKYIEVVTRDSKRYFVFQDKFAGGSTGGGPSSGPSLAAIDRDSYSEEGFERKKGKITMTGMYRDKLVNQDLAKVLMQATAEPFLQGTQIAGFKMSQIDEDSIFAKSGLRDGDIVTAVNGQELNSVAGSISLLKSLKGANSLEVEIIRDGTPQSVTVTVQE